MKISRHIGTFGRRLCLITLLSLGLSELSAEPPTVGMPIINPPSVSLGAQVTLAAIGINGTPPLSYQWQLDGEDIHGAINDFLVLWSVQMSDAGQYTVVVRNAEGEAISPSVTLEVDPTFTKITDGDIVNEVAAGVGAAWADYDNDGLLDLVVANGGGGGGRAEPDYLYRNNGDGTFTKITEGLLVTYSGHSGYPAWGDYDNDGFTDLFVGAVEIGTGYLHHNLGDGTFEQIETDSIGIGWVNGTGVWGDYDQDGFLDLFVGARSGYSHLYRNNGDGTFSEITDIPPVTTSGSASSSVWADYDNDGQPDLFVANSSGRNFLFANHGGGQFARIQDGPIVNDSDYSIGSAWGDYDNDGFLDLFVANGDWSGGLHQNWLYHNNGAGEFTKITEGSLVTDRRPWVAGSWADFDNDGDLDLFVSAFRYTSSHNNALHRNNGDGTFTEVTTGSIARDGSSTGYGSLGAAWGDYDKDGFPDLFVATWDGKNLLYRNNGNDNHWITVQCEGRVSNRSAIGTKVRVQATIQGRTYWQMREISNGDGKSGNSLDACFGLGDARIIDRIRIEWPSGIVQELANVAVDQFLTVIEERQLVLSCAIRPENGAFVLMVTAEPGQTVRIYASEDLANWEEKESFTGSGEVEIPSPDSGIQLYKAEAEP